MSMNVTIHRHPALPRASFIEISSGSSTIIIDPGACAGVGGLTAPFTAARAGLPDIRGLYAGEEKKVAAVLVAGIGLDRPGLLDFVHIGIPVYMDRAAKALLEASNIIAHAGSGAFAVKTLLDHRAARIGPFSVTPYMVDRSGVGAFAFLIEADGKRLFCSVDRRGHGHRAALFKGIIGEPLKGIDCLIIDGIGDEPRYRDESAVCGRIAQILKAAGGITFLFAFPNDIERISSAHAACLKAGAVLVIDLFTALVLSKLGTVCRGVVQYDTRGVRVRCFSNDVKSLRERGYAPLVFAYGRNSIDVFEMRRKKNRILMLVRDRRAFLETVKEVASTAGIVAIDATRRCPLANTLRDACAAKAVAIERVDAGASVNDIVTFVDALKPGRLVIAGAEAADRTLPGSLKGLAMGDVSIPFEV